MKIAIFDEGGQDRFLGTTLIKVRAIFCWQISVEKGRR
jgi:hypothetical protein